MSKERFAAEIKAIDGYAKDVESEVDSWTQAGSHIKSGTVDSSAFTNNGTRIANAYGDLVEDYAWYAWRIGVTLERLASALHATAKHYGEAEAIVKDNINDIGKQF